MKAVIILVLIAIVTFVLSESVFSSTECPLLKCPKNCDYGYKLDKRGCRTCECLGKPSVVFCPTLVPCTLKCKNGYKKAKSGCLLCECKKRGRKNRQYNRRRKCNQKY
ncbi:hypothetical protein ABK040_015380 [Willaertia magna]